MVVAIDGEPVVGGWIHMTEIIEKNPGRRMEFTVRRNDGIKQLSADIESKEEPQPDGSEKTVGKVGLAIRFTTKKVTPLEVVPLAFERTVYIAGQTLGFFGKLVTGRMSPKLIGGPVLIAQVAGESAKSGFATLFGFTAFISINLGVLNLLPFPVLDGGHIAILLIEGIIRRKLSVRFRMAMQQAGSIVLLLLMIYITFNDLLRFDTISRMFGG